LGEIYTFINITPQASIQGDPIFIQSENKVVGFEVLTVALKKIFIFWDTMPSTDVSEDHFTSVIRVEE
jgi:hypothetical protein